MNKKWFKTTLLALLALTLVLAACSPNATQPAPIVEAPIQPTITPDYVGYVTTPTPPCETYEVQVGDSISSGHWGFFATTVPDNGTITVGAVKTQLEPNLYAFHLAGSVTWCHKPEDALDALLASPGEPTFLANLVNLGYIEPGWFYVTDIEGAACTGQTQLEGWETYTSDFTGIYTTYTSDGVLTKTTLPPGTYRFRTFGTVEYCSMSVDEAFFTTPGVEVELQTLIYQGYLEVK